MKTGLIIALDFSEISEALGMVKRIGDFGTFYKVGLELFISGGGSIIPALKDMGKKIFLDLKLHDIPNTVKGALAASLNYGADIVNVHAQGGREMLLAAADTRMEYSAKTGTYPKIIAVTLLTSLSEAYLKEYGIKTTPREYALKLAKFAKDAGLDGAVSSAKESREIKTLCGTDFITVTPGIRLAGNSPEDQKRVVTPRDAARAGTDYIVVGRPITRSAEPSKAAGEFLHSLEDA